MPFDYRNHYKKLISDLTKLIAKSIEEIPETDKDMPSKEKQNTDAVTYSDKKHHKQN